MKRSIAIFTTGILFFISAYSQSGADDYWLNNGFTDGETVITNSGWFYDDGGDDVYNQGQDWSVTFCSENGNPITLDFSNFKTHFGGIPGDDTYGLYDYMTIDIPSGGNYVAYNDDTPVFSFTSESGCITIGFHSDNDGQIDSGWVAEIYAIPPPDNNDPSIAEELIVGNVCSPSYFTNKGAFNTTNLGDPPCKDYFGGDVWFTLEVPASGEVKIETFAGSLTYAILDIYRSNDSNITDGERIACVDDAGAMPSVTLASPTVSPGDILYIRLFGEQAKSGLFGICASDPSSPVTGFTGPGGVGNSESLDYWFKADSGVLNTSGVLASNGETVRTWEDQSGNGRNMDQSNTAYQSVLNTNAINSLGGLVFDGTDDLYEIESGSGDAPMHWFAAAAFSGTQRQTMLSVGDVLASRTASIGRHSDGRYFSYTNGDLYGPVLSDDQYYIFNVSHQSASPYHYLELDGLSQTVDADPAALESDGSLQVGAAWDLSDPFDGMISELIQYNKKLNSAQEIIVNNYLAAKYNIELDDNNYYPYKTTYSYDVAGIGRLNVSSFHTKAQSAGILSVSDADNLGNDEFLFFGHDNGDLHSWSSIDVPSGDTNIVRLEREWRVAFIGDPGTVTIGLQKSMLPALPAGFVSYNILVDANGDFSSGAVAYGPFNLGDEMLANDIDLDNGDYIAIAAIRPVLSFSSATYSEYEDVANPALQVELNYGVSEIVEVTYEVSGGTAVQGTDFQLLPSSVFINPGDQTAEIVPLIIDDAVVEDPDEYFDVEISSPTTGITVGSITTARHTILNDDLELVLDSDVTEIGECVTSFATITAAPAGTGPFTFAWSPATGLDVTDNDTVHANPSATTTYTCEVTDGLGQSLSENIEIQVSTLPAAPVVSASGATSICQGDSVQLNATAGYTTYLWSTGETTASIWVSSSGNYTTQGIDAFGCITAASNMVTVTVNALPDAPGITPDGPLSFCDGDSVVFTAGGTHSSYTWSDNSTENTLIAKTAGEYYVFGTDANGCVSENSDTLDVVLFSNPLQPTINATDTETCDGDSILLSAPAGYTSYLWSDGQSSQDIYVKSSGDYSVTVSDANSCSSPASDEVQITILPNPAAPTITGDGPLTFCDGDDVTLSGSGTYPEYTWSDGYTGQSRFVEGSGEFAVKVRDGNLCESPYSDSVTVTELEPLEAPVISISGELGICAGDSTILIAPAGFAAYLWSDGSTNDSLFVKSTGDYTVSVVDANSCSSPVSDITHIEVHPLPAQPVITSNGGSAICDGESLTLSVTGSFVGYSWSNGSADAEILVSSGGSYTVHVTDANTCVSPESEAFEVQVNSLPEAPTISGDGPLTFCDGDDVTLSGSGTYPEYTWSDGYTGQSRLVEGSGDFAVKVRDGNLCESPYSDSVTVTELAPLAAPTVSVSGELDLCAGDSSILIAPAGYSTYLWSDGSSNDSLIVKSTGDYSVSVIDANTCTSPFSDIVHVEVHPLPAQPVITSNGGSEICDGEALTLSVTGSFEGYAWSTGSTDPEIVISTGGSYTVHITDVNTCVSPESEAFEVQVNSLPEAPTLSADGPLAFCDGLDVTLSASGTYPLYTWSDDETGQDRTISLAGDYSVKVTDVNGCESAFSDVQTVTVFSLPEKPVVSAVGATEFCSGDSVILAGPTGFAAYSWSDGSDTDSISIKANATLNLIVTDDNSCQSESSDDLIVTVNENPLKPVIQANSDTEFCEGGSVSLEADAGYTSYSWSDGGTGQVRDIQDAGDYSVVVEDAKGCISPSSDPVSVTVHALPADPVITPAGPEYVIIGDSIELVCNDADEYLWSPGGETSKSIFVKESGSYSVQVKNAYGCESAISNIVEVTVSEFIAPPSVDSSGMLSFCDGGEVILIGEAGFASYSWSNGSSGQELTVTESMTVTLTVTDAEGHTSFPSEELIIVVHDLPVLNVVQANDPLCYGSTDGQIEVSASGTEPIDFSWQDRTETTSTLSGVGAGDYWAFATDANGCENGIHIELTEPDEITYQATVTPATCPEIADGSVQIQISGGTSPYLTYWESEESNGYESDLAAGDYSLEIVDANECSVEATVNVGVESQVCFVIPEIITPNGDTHNDFWYIEGLENYPGVTIEVFDRWGKRVFYSEGHNEYFDGTYNGKDLPMESYHYVIDLHDGSERIIGNITIIR